MTGGGGIMGGLPSDGGFLNKNGGSSSDNNVGGADQSGLNPNRQRGFWALSTRLETPRLSDMRERSKEQLLQGF